MKKLAQFAGIGVAVFAFVFALSATYAHAATYYVDFAAGSDANSGTVKTTPWQHAPGMAGCSGACSSSTPTAGDRFIFKGGVTWPNASFPMAWQWSGTSASSIYLGVDLTWFAGGSWTRPIFDAGSSVIAGAKNAFVVFGSGVQHVTLDNIEMKNLFWTGTPGYSACEYIQTYNTQNLLLDHLYLHAWRHAASGATDDCFIILGDTNAPYNAGSVFQNGIIDGSDGSSDSGQGFHGFPSVKNSIIHDIPNMILLTGHGEISGNHLYNCTVSFTGSHENALESLIADGPYYIHDNVIHDTQPGCESSFLGNAGETDYVWNNLYYNLGGNPPDLDAAIAAYFWNNTIVPLAGNYCLHQGHAGTTGTITFQNNQCINTLSQAADPGLQANTLVIDHNVLQTPTTANGQGYTAGETYPYSPTSGSNATVGAGVNLTSSCSGNLSTLCSDTTLAGMRTSTSRPASGAWDAGAYQFSSGGTGDTQAPSVSITSPASGATISGTQTVSASASDNVGVTKVEFYADGILKATDTSSPYSFSLDTTALTNGSHTLSAKAYDAAGNIGTSAGVSVTVSNSTPDTQAPSVPANLSATAVSSSQINLSWTASTDNVGVTGYKVFRNGTEVGTAATNSYSDTGLTPSTLYSYTVAACDAAGNTSAQSTSASATTQASAGATTYFGGVADSSGTPISGGNDGLSGFVVQIDPTASANVTVPGSGLQNVVSLGIYGDVTSGGANFRSAIYGPIDGVHDNNFVMQGATKINVTATSNAWIEHTTFVDQSGNPIANPQLIGGDKYQLVSSADGTTGFFAFGAVGSHNHYVGGDYSNGYPATISVTTDMGTEMPDIRVGVQAPAASSDTTAPSVSTGLSATAVSSSQINLSWTASTDNVGVTGYKVSRGGVQVGTSPTASYSDTGLSPSTAYTYTVAAYDAAGNTSAQSTSASATTQALTPPVLQIGARVSTTAKVNVRNMPSTAPNSKILGTQPSGAQGTITQGPKTGSGYTWWYVNFDSGKDGWVAANYLQAQQVAFSSSAQGNLVTVLSPVRVRTAPSLSGSILGVLLPYAQGTVIDGPQTADSHTWLKAIYPNGLTGWTASAYLSINPAPAAGGTQSVQDIQTQISSLLQKVAEMTKELQGMGR